MPKRKASHNLHLRQHSRYPNSPRLAVLLALIASYSVTAQTVTPQTIEEQPIDWVPRSELTAAEQAELSPFCLGAFREPEADYEDANLDPQQAPIRIEADQTSITNGSRILLQGDVQITQGERSLQAERITYNRETESASLEGGMQIRQPGTLIRGEEAHVDMGGNQASFTDAEFLLHEQHLRGGARKIEQTEEKIIILTDGRITSCEPVEESWVLEGGKLKLDPAAGQGSGRDLVLRFGGLPVLYLPYIRFPLGDKRQSGFLFPVASYSQRNGLDLAVPYYFNLAPNYDLTLTPRIITERGAMLEAEGRHLSDLFQTRASLAYLPDDQGGEDPDYTEIIERGLATEEQLHPYTGSDRWLVSLEQKGGFNRPWYSVIDYNAASDLDYFRDLDASSFSVASSTYLNQSAEVGYLFENWTVRGRLQDFQTLLRGLDETYRQLPRVDANGAYHWSDFHLQLNNEYVYFDHSHEMDANDAPIITGQRARANYWLTWDSQHPWGYLRPQVGVQHLSYLLDDQPLTARDPESIALTAPQAAVDLTLLFDRYNRDSGALEQTLEPRLFYLYRDHVDHSPLYDLTAADQALNFDTTPLNFNYSQLFRDNRFSGGDRIGDANHLALGMTSRWYGGAGQRELMSLSAGQILYFGDRQVTLSGEPETAATSDIATQVQAYVTDDINLRADVLIDDGNAQVSRSSIFAQYADPEKLANIGYRYISSDAVGATTEEDVEQIDLSFSTSLTRQWRLVGRTNYDISDGRELEIFAGIEYNDCCYGFRVLARRWLDSKIADLITDKNLEYDQGIFFEIHLRGLGGTGDRVRSILEDSIVGYREQQLLFDH